MVPIPPSLHVAARPLYVTPADADRLAALLSAPASPHHQLLGLLQSPAASLARALQQGVAKLDILKRTADFGYLARYVERERSDGKGEG